MSGARLSALLVSLALFTSSSLAHGQACCAGASAITPARLELHERALLGTQLRFAHALGTFNSRGDFRSTPAGASEQDFEQDLFGSIRWLERGQVSLLVPLLVSRRRSATTGAELGGGWGDLNVGLRYDLVRNRERSYLPGIGLLAGATFPTGRAPEAAKQPLASDATGIGATQLTLGLALERAFGRVLLNVTGLVSQRLSRTVSGVESELAAQLTAVLGASYSFSNGAAAALVLTYNHEGDATVDGRTSPSSGRRQLRTSLGVSAALTDSWRLQGNVFIDPPLSGLGRNQPATLGATAGAIWSFL